MSNEKKLGYHGPRGMVRYDIPPAPESDKRFTPGIKTITEAQRETKVLNEADVIVVGGGPGGVAAAITAARSGARTVLIERYGHLGGMATGGLVNILPNMGDVYGNHLIGGFCHEFIQRLQAQDAAFAPAPAQWGSTEPQVLKYYKDASFHHFFVRRNAEGKECLVYSAILDPEIGKNELNRMAMEAGVKLLLHSWVSDVVMEGDTVKGVIFQSKSGRQAVLGKVIIDCTGDGDLLPFSGAESEDYIDPDFRITHLCFGVWIGGVEFRAFDKFMSAQPDDYTQLMNDLYDNGLYVGFFRGMLKNQENMAWLHPHFKTKCQTDVEEMSRMDVAGREKAVKTWELLRDRAPGFEKSYIMLTGPQLGTTGGRRLVGQYSLRESDLYRTEPFEDTIAIFANNDRAEESLKFNKIYVPYRALLPKDVKGLMVACRAFSSDDVANTYFNLIPHCMCFGQAAGAAAAIAVEKGIDVKDVPYAELKAKLIEGGAILP